MKHGKKYIDSAKTIESAKLYEVDEAFGLVETVEKTAQLYMLAQGHKTIHVIPDEILKGLADLWNLTPLEGVLKLKK